MRDKARHCRAFVLCAALFSCLSVSFFDALLPDDLNPLSGFDCVGWPKPVEQTEALDRMIEAGHAVLGHGLDRIPGPDRHDLQPQGLGLLDLGHAEAAE